MGSECGKFGTNNESLFFLFRQIMKSGSALWYIILSRLKTTEAMII